MTCDTGYILIAGECGLKENPTTTQPADFTVTHIIVLQGMTANQFNDDPVIIKSFRESVAILLSVETTAITNIVATSTSRRLFATSIDRLLASSSCSVSYDVKVNTETEMEEMITKMSSTYSDSAPFTSEMQKNMKANSVTSVSPSSVTADTTTVPQSSGTAVADKPTNGNENSDVGGIIGAIVGVLVFGGLIVGGFLWYRSKPNHDANQHDTDDASKGANETPPQATEMRSFVVNPSLVSINVQEKENVIADHFHDGDEDGVTAESGFGSGSDWTTYEDLATGKTYLYNHKTGDTKWVEEGEEDALPNQNEN